MVILLFRIRQLISFYAFVCASVSLHIFLSISESLDANYLFVILTLLSLTPLIRQIWRFPGKFDAHKRSFFDLTVIDRFRLDRFQLDQQVDLNALVRSGEIEGEVWRADDDRVSWNRIQPPEMIYFFTATNNFWYS